MRSIPGTLKQVDPKISDRAEKSRTLPTVLPSTTIGEDLIEKENKKMRTSQKDKVK